MTNNNKKLEEIWAEVPADYYFHLGFLQKIWHEWKWLVFQNLLSKTSTPRTVLEVGCAGGHLSGLLKGLFPKAKITGIDVYEAAVAEAARRFPQLTFKVADAHKLPFASQSYDLVVCSETIEHVVDPEKVIREMGRVLKKDGSLLIEMDSGSGLFRVVWAIWTKWGKGKVWKDAHLHPFTARELEQLIKTCGFRIKYKLISHAGMAISFLCEKEG